jgi:hypothetical protein
MLNWTAANLMMHEEYLPVMEKHIFLDDYVTKYINKYKKVETVGSKFNEEYQYSWAEGTGMMTDATSNLSYPAEILYKTFRGTTKLRNGVVQIYSAIAKLMNGPNAKTFINEVKAQTEGLMNAMKAEQDRMIVGDGGNTPMTHLAADTGATDASPSVFTCASGYTTKRLRPGMVIEVRAANDAAITNAARVQITNIVSDTVFTVELVVTAGDRTTLVAAINAGSAHVYHVDGYQKEFQGFETLFNSITNTVFEVNRSTNAGAWYRPQVWKIHTDNTCINGARAGTAQDWELYHIDKVVDDLTERRGATQDQLRIFANKALVRYAIILKQAMGESNVAQEKIDLWPYKVPSYGGIPILSPPSLWDNTMYIQEMDGWVKFESFKLGWDDTDGDTWKWVGGTPGVAAYKAFMIEMAEYGHYHPWRCATINDMASA